MRTYYMCPRIIKSENVAFFSVIGLQVYLLSLKPIYTLIHHNKTHISIFVQSRPI